MIIDMNLSARGSAALNVHRVIHIIRTEEFGAAMFIRVDCPKYIPIFGRDTIAPHHLDKGQIVKTFAGMFGHGPHDLHLEGPASCLGVWCHKREAHHHVGYFLGHIGAMRLQSGHTLHCPCHL